jgi:hypothetical protein
LNVRGGLRDIASTNIDSVLAQRTTQSTPV